MALDPEIRHQAAKIFAQEAPELLARLEQGLLTLRQDHSLPKLHHLLRAAHSLKGGAANLALNGLHTLAGRLELVFRALYQQSPVEIDLELENLLLQVFDQVRLAVLSQVEQHSDIAEQLLEETEPLLSQVFARLNCPPDQDLELPSSAELGIDVIETLFITDVAQGLERLERILADPTSFELPGELQAQTEVFLGIGELVNCSAFCAIAQTTLAALSLNPRLTTTIGQLAVADFRAVQQAVLKKTPAPLPAPNPRLVQLSQNPDSGLADPDSTAGALADLDALEALEAIFSGNGTEDSGMSPPAAAIAGQTDRLTIASEVSPILAPETAEELETLLSQLTLESGQPPFGDGQGESPALPQFAPRVEPLPVLDLDEPYRLFIHEAQEQLQQLEQGLLNLQQDHSVPAIHSLMRAAHSIKGGAASLGLTAIQAIAHGLEEVFRALYRQDRKIDLALEEQLLQGFDCLRLPLLAQIEQGYHDPEAAIARAEPLLSQLQTDLGVGTGEEPELPSAADLGVDVVQSLFELDVAAGLTQLEATLAKGMEAEIGLTLRTQAETFAGIGEILNLPGFVAIARTTLTALDQPAQDIPTLAKIALEDFRAAQTAVLNGDRSEGGTVSSALAHRATPIPAPAETGLHLPPLGPPATLTEPAELTELAALLGDLLPEAELEALNPAIAPLSSDPIPPAPLELAEDRFEEPLEDPIEELSELDLPNLNDLFDPALLNSLIQQPELPPETHNRPAISAPSDPASPEIPAVDTPEAALAALEQFFPQLPTATDLAPLPSPTPPRPRPEPGVQSSPTVPLPSVRVELPRLERLNNRVGEMVTQENSLLLQHQQLQETLASLLQRFSQFANLSKTLQDWADRLTLAPQPSVPQPPTSTQTEFDALQLDSYNDLYTLVESAVEEIAQLEEAVQDISLITQQAQQTLKHKQRTLRQVREDLLWARMLPLEDILRRFPRMVRDLAASHHKQVALKLLGVNTLVDKAVLEKLYDPLVHLVRNAFDHGIEPPEVRQAQGKPPQGTIEIRAYHRGNQTYIQIRDDGRGIDLTKIWQRIVELNLLSAAEAARLPQEQLYDYLFTPGFSTAAQVSQISGRGVGLDTVRLQVAQLKGGITLSSQPGQGTTFTLRLPLTLTIANLLIFGIDKTLLALPLDALIAILSVPTHQIETLQEGHFYRWQGQLLPLHSLKSQLTFRYPLPPESAGQIPVLRSNKAGEVSVLLLSDGIQTLALEIDYLVLEQELAIKPFGNAIAPPAYLYGCTILADGRLVPVIDAPALIQHCLEGVALPPSAAAPAISPVPARRAPLILVVDDSPTIRSSLNISLRKGGYEAVAARNGREALELLRQNPAIQAVISDVEMPQMNGFEFLSQRRQEFRDRPLPVIMLTSRSSEKHRQLATLLGANAYLTKPYLEPELLKLLKEQLSLCPPPQLPASGF